MSLVIAEYRPLFLLDPRWTGSSDGNVNAHCRQLCAICRGADFVSLLLHGGRITPALSFDRGDRTVGISQRPDAMAFLIERELATLAHHQHIAKLRGADGRRRTSSFADLLILSHLLAMPKNRSEGEQS